MSRGRTIVLALSGVLLLLVGVIVAGPEWFGPLAPLVQRSLEAWLGNTGLALFLIGLAAVLSSAVIASGSSESAATATRVDLESVLGGVNSAVTGAAFDRQLRELAEPLGVDEREELESRLREAVHHTAVTVLARTDGPTVSAARASIERGEWTTDPQAAAFFTRSPLPWLVRLREWLRPQPGFEQRLERVLFELETKMELDERSSHESHHSRSDAAHGLRPDAEGRGVRHRVDDPERGSTSDRTEATVRVGPDDSSEELIASRRFGLAVGLIAVAVGLITSVTTPFVLGFLAVGYSLTKYVTRSPAPAIEVTRVVAAEAPVPGDLVEVELTVENVGDRPLPDLRVIDAPPEALPVVDGAPSMATSLPPGGSASLRYVLRAVRGTFTFEETRLVSRDLGNVKERSIRVDVPSRLTGSTSLDEPALREQANQRIGAVKTDRAGSGVEFYGTREYRPGDPLSRVDWNQLAKTGELTTVDFREQRAPTVSIVLDQRESSRIAPTTASLDAVDLGVYAAEQTFLTLLELGTDVGLVTYGDRLTDVEPASGSTQRALVQSRLRATTDRYAAALGGSEVDATGAVFQRLSPEPAMIDYHVPQNAQVLLLSPVTDEFAVEVTDRLAAVGHPVTVLSPSVAGTGSLGARRARLERACRLEALRDQGTPVIDWRPDEPLQLAVSRATGVMAGP